MFSGRIEIRSSGEIVGGMEKVKVCRVVEFREPVIWTVDGLGNIVGIAF